MEVEMLKYYNIKLTRNEAFALEGFIRNTPKDNEGNYNLISPKETKTVDSLHENLQLILNAK